MSLIRKYNEDTKVWLMSDLHLGHDREFVWAKRGFSNIQEHNDTIIQNIKDNVGEDDDFYILGDLTLGDLAAAAPYLRQIPGHVHVILGNHDTDRRVEFYESLGWDVQFSTVIRWNKYRFYLSHYPTNTTNSGEEYLSLATINIYGHTHQSDSWKTSEPFSFCVCPEAIQNTPIEISEIVSLLTVFNSILKVSRSTQEISESMNKLADAFKSYSLSSDDLKD